MGIEANIKGIGEGLAADHHTFQALHFAMSHSALKENFMSKAVTSIAKIISLAAFTATMLSALPASAGSQHLACNAGYKKVATFANSIKCRQIRFAATRQEVPHLSSYLHKTGRCNAHSGHVKIRVIKLKTRYKVQAAFICANIM